MPCLVGFPEQILRCPDRVGIPAVADRMGRKLGAPIAIAPSLLRQLAVLQHRNVFLNLGRWMRIFIILNQSSIPVVYSRFTSDSLPYIKVE